MHEDRKRIWIDGFQTRLVWRTFFYWLIYTLSLWNLLFAWRLLQEGPGDPIEQYTRFFFDFYAALIVAVLIFPVLAWDAIRFGHRVVGPLYRFRKTLQSVAAGEAVRPIKLRQGDFLHEMRDDFNRALEALQRRGVPVLKPAEPDDESRRQPA